MHQSQFSKVSWQLIVAGVVFLTSAFTIASPVSAAEPEAGITNQTVVFGAKVRAGGRFDNVRMCVASPAGAQGGPAADISLFAEIPLVDRVSLDLDLPFFRPVLFGLAFQMLQFEPSATLKFRKVGSGKVDLIAGPTLGVSLHYGPDYKSGPSGSARTSSFFAMGPMIGGYFGLDFKRPNQAYNFQLGLTPYVEALFGINDPQNHRGVVVGGLLDLQFRFGKPRA